MAYQRVLTIQDISCFGQCSLTVALPILSACGLETVILPSAVLSTHTAGFSGYTFRDMTEDIPQIAAHWKKEQLSFHAIYTGYLGSTKQVDYVRKILADFGGADCRKIVDPAMADNGKLYPGFDNAFVQEMKKLCWEADILLPNITEACFLTDTPYPETYDAAFIDGLLRRLAQCGAKTVVLTGVGYTPDTTGVVVLEGGAASYYRHRRLPQSCHGTGDVYASAFTGALMQGCGTFAAAQIAADYTVLCMEKTIGDPSHWYGVKFEAALPELMRLLKR